MESKARQRWCLVKANLVSAELQEDVQKYRKRAAAIERWRLVQRALLPDISRMSTRATNRQQSPTKDTSTRVHNAKTNPQSAPSSQDSAQRLRAVSAHLRGVEAKGRTGREPSVTALDSPYRAALDDLADLDWQFTENERKTPMPPTIPQLSTVHYHPNHEAFYDEETGIPVPKSSTMSIKRPGTCSTVLFNRSSGLPDVDEAMSRTCIQTASSRRKRVVTLRLRNLRLSISQTVGRYIRSCLHPDVRV